VSRAGRKREAIGHERRDDGDLLRVPADDPLGKADGEVNPARHFHRRCSHDDGEDNKEHFAGYVRRRASKTTTSTCSSPTAPHKPSPTPPMRAPMASAPAITRNSRISLQSIQFESPSTPSGGLLGLRVCQFKDREIVAECLRQGVDRQKAFAPAVPGTQNPRNCLRDRVASLV
jgi:hypothetical protein